MANRREKSSCGICSAVHTPLSHDQVFSWSTTKNTEFWNKCAMSFNAQQENIKDQNLPHPPKYFATEIFGFDLEYSGLHFCPQQNAICQRD